MPTEPLDDLLSRELAKEDATQINSIASPLLIELVNYATQMIGRCAPLCSRESSQDIPLILLYRHLTEMVDGVQVLLADSSPVPAFLLVRSAFEALLAMDYILEAD